MQNRIFVEQMHSYDYDLSFMRYFSVLHGKLEHVKQKYSRGLELSKQ